MENIDVLKPGTRHPRGNGDPHFREDDRGSGAAILERIGNTPLIPLQVIGQEVPGVNQIFGTLQNHDQATMNILTRSHIRHHGITFEAMLSQNRSQEEGQRKAGTAKPVTNVTLDNFFR